MKAFRGAKLEILPFLTLALDVSGQPHASAPLPLGKEPTLPTE